MSTQEQLNANRKNAEKSTGPKTADGKAISSQNAVKHGFFAKNDVISGEDPKVEISDAAIILAGIVRYENEPISTDPAVDEAMNTALSDPVNSHICEAEIELGTVIYNDFHGSAVIERLQSYEQRIESSLFKTIRQYQQFQATRIKQDADRDRRAMQILRAEDQARRDREEAEYQRNLRDEPNPDTHCHPERSRGIRQDTIAEGDSNQKTQNEPNSEPLNVLQEYELRKIGRLPKPRNEPNIPLTSITETTYNRSRDAKAKTNDPQPQYPDDQPGRSDNK